MLIKSTSSINTSKIKAVLLGAPGVGKTTTCSTLLKYRPIIISAEAGTLSLSHSDIPMIDISRDENDELVPEEQRISKLGEAYQYLMTVEAREKYGLIFIDSLSEISANLIKELEKSEKYADEKMALVRWGEFSRRMKSLIKSFRDLPYYHCLFTALSSIDKDENNRRYIGVDMPGKLAAQLPAYFDLVAYLYVQQKEDGSRERVIITGSTDGVTAKDRSGRLNQQEPCDMGAIFDKILNQNA